MKDSINPADTNLSPRDQEILTGFLLNDRIWPPYITNNWSHPFIKALITVLKTLPDSAFDHIESTVVSIILDDCRAFAVNAPYQFLLPPIKESIKLSKETIVFFPQCLALSQKALVGLIAHELAHSFENQKDYKTDEDAVDALARRWGFTDEITALREEKSGKYREFVQEQKELLLKYSPTLKAII